MSEDEEIVEIRDPETGEVVGYEFRDYQFRKKKTTPKKKKPRPKPGTPAYRWFEELEEGR